MTQYVNSSEIWQQKDETFSSWLVKNLNLLDEVLSTQLDLERPVGSFFADLLCRNRADDSLVVIENQLDRTDHKHLGQLLAYTTELQAHTIIWIATEFADEHQQILDWLNNNVNDNFRFFGVQLVLKPIDDSGYIPKFNLVTRPQDKHRQQTREVSKPTSENSSDPLYWSEFREYSAKSGSTLKPWEWNEDRHPNYFGFHIGGLEDIWFVAWRNAAGTRIAAKLVMYAETTELYFDRLKEQQGAIESEFGETLDWSRNPNYSKYPQVGLYQDVSSDKAYWSEQFEWLYATLGKLDTVFRTRISECTRSEYHSPTIIEPRNTSSQQNDFSSSMRYWSEFQKHCNDKGMSLIPLPPEFNDDNYYGFHIEGVPEGIFWLAAWRKTNGTEIAANLHLRLRENPTRTVLEKVKNVDALDAFDTLVKQKEVIETSFGGPLKWNRHPIFPALGPLVGLYWKPDSADESDWPFQFEWMRRNLEKLGKVFRPFVRDIISLV